MSGGPPEAEGDSSRPLSASAESPPGRGLVCGASLHCLPPPAHNLLPVFTALPPSPQVGPGPPDDLAVTCL